MDHQLVIFIDSWFRYLNERMDRMALTLDDLVNKTTALKSVVDTAVATLASLKTKLDVAIATHDPAKVQAVADAIDASQLALSTAVAVAAPTT